MPSVDVADLLRVPYRRGSRDPALGLDCYTAAEAVAARVPCLEGAARGLSELAALETLTRGDGSWTLLGREACLARMVGDLLLTDSPGAPAGLAMLVDPGGRLFITATPERGVHLAHARAFKDLAGVYRWDGTA